jgi:hypothetical protein
LPASIFVFRFDARRMDKDDLDEQKTLLDVYRRALGMLPAESEAAE